MANGIHVCAVPKEHQLPFWNKSLDRNENYMYRNAVREGILKGHYSRSQFHVCTHQLYIIGDVGAGKEIGLHQAIQE